MPRKPSKPKPSPTRTVRRWCVWSPTRGFYGGTDPYLWIVWTLSMAEATAKRANEKAGKHRDWQPRRCTVTVEVEKGGKR